MAMVRGEREIGGDGRQMEWMHGRGREEKKISAKTLKKNQEKNPP